jgi:hypothetical protein
MEAVLDVAIHGGATVVPGDEVGHELRVERVP